MAKANRTKKTLKKEETLLNQTDPLLAEGNSDSIAREDKDTVVASRSGKLAENVKESIPTPKKSRQEVNMETVSTVLRPSGSGVSADAGGSTRMAVTFSGTDSLVVGRESQTPVQGIARQGSPRYIRKDESIVRSIDDVANAQVYVDIDGPKPIGEDPETPQGYAGKEIPKSVLIQKLSGITPSERQFAASIDMVTRDHMIYVDKQIVENETDPNVSPAYNFTFDEETGTVVQGAAYSNIRQNFKPVKLTATFVDGVLTGLTPSCDDLSILSVSDEVINRSSPAALINRNRIEAARRKIEELAGDPKQENFSPLGRKINYPNGVLNLMKDYESMTGAEVMASFRSLNHALSYQINKAAKDGHRPYQAAHEMSYSAICNAMSSDDVLALGTGDRPMFDKSLLAIGGANLLVACFDTTRKYNTRGDFLTISKSYRQFVDQASNHLESFRMPQDLLPYYNNVDCFSTIDRDYDELLPVYATEFISLIHPRKWENCSTIGPNLVDSKAYNIIYNDDIDYSISSLEFPLLKGIARYLARHARKIHQTAGDLDTPLTLIIPVQHSKIHVTLWDQLVCASCSDIEYARQQSLRDLLFYEKAFGPAFDDLVNLSTDVTKAKMFGFTDFVSPLTVGKMTDEIALTWILPETFSNLGKDTSGIDCISFMMPFYFSDSSLVGFSTDLDEENCFVNDLMIRYGMSHSNLLKFRKLNPRDVRLTYDIVTDIPAHFKGTGCSSSGLKYSRAQSGPAVLIRETAGVDFPPISDILCLPRELGLGFVPVSFYGRYYSDGSQVDISDEFDGSLTYIAWSWKADGTVSNALGASFASNVARGANFQQKWEVIPAIHAGAGTDTGKRVCISLNGMLNEDGVVAGETLFSPFPLSASVWGNDKLPRLMSLNKAFYFQLRYLDFFLSPFDVACQENTIREGNEILVDPFEKAYIYGFVGFLPSEYTEDHRMRTQITDAAGLSYFEDYYHDATPLLK